MIQKMREKIDYDLPGYLYREPAEYLECTCDCCGQEVEEVGDLYELDGEQLCMDCLLEKTRVRRTA